MKYLLFVSLLCVAALCSCKKSAVFALGYFGKWQLVKTDWSFTVNSGVIIPSPDSTIILNFKADKTYSYELNGAITSSGTFQVDTLLPATVEIKITQLVPSSIIYSPQVIEVINDTLRISTLPTPAGITSYTYIRKMN